MIVKPGLFLLTIFGLATLLAILIMFYLLSLPFMSMLEFEAKIYIWCPIILFTTVTYLIDFKYKTKFIRYAFISIMALIIAYLIFPSTKKWIIKNTEARGETLVEIVHSYKIKYGYYPKTLNDPFFKNSPKTAIINRKFFYELHQNSKKDTFFSISCYSFDGYWARRFDGDKEWKYFD